MQKLHTKSGFSLLELMVVVGILGILVAVAVPGLLEYRTRESARANAQNIAAILADARSRAIDQGSNYLVLFASPVVFRNPLTGVAPPIAQVVRDVNGDWVNNAGDVVQSVFAAQDTPAAVGPYLGGAAPFGPSPLPLEDPARGGFPNLAALANGASLPTQAGATALGFSPRGVPVNLATPTAPGSGAGAFYVTDNNKTVYAVVLLPLGGIRVRALDPITNTWL